MARAYSSDPFQISRYVVSFVDGSIVKAGAGFSSVTMPELSIESVEYREGLNLFSRKYPLKPSVSSVTLSRGVLLKDSGLFDWIMRCVDGRGYRSSVVIRQYHRTDIGGLREWSGADASRTITCFNAFPIRYRPSADFDPVSSEISVEEIELEIEYFKVEHAKGMLR